jgi:hypothetical protein
MKKSGKKRIGRPPGRKAPHRPIVSARVPFELHAKIEQSARKAGRNISEELVWRAELSYKWEAAFVDVEKFRAQSRAEWDEIQSGNLENFLRSKNWKRVAGARFGNANWISPDNHSYPPSGFVDPAAEAGHREQAEELNRKLENAIERVVVRAVKAALEERNSPCAEASPAAARGHGG